MPSIVDKVIDTNHIAYTITLDSRVYEVSEYKTLENPNMETLELPKWTDFPQATVNGVPI